jgi:hypothetical protein
MILRAIVNDHHATKLARNKGFLRNEVGGDRSCSVVIGSRLAVDLASPFCVDPNAEVLVEISSAKRVLPIPRLAAQ